MHKDVKDLVSVIITLGKDISGGDTVFYDGAKNLTLGVELIYLNTYMEEWYLVHLKKFSMKVLCGVDIYP